ncbi:MAG TPA: multicopper oxidase domain-containing protein [Terriglobales bacterium]|nr:multicopper oxidase domain-containing protein [Terriglobales bacterium]
MRFVCNGLLVIVVCGGAFLQAAGQALCPARPESGTVVQDALSLVPQNGVLSAEFVMGHSVDDFGYTHYCYDYKTATGVAEAPTLRLNQGDTLELRVVDRIQGDDSMGMKMKMHSVPAAQACGDTGQATLQSTNVHFHGLNVSPVCHQDDVLTTLIQPGTPGFAFKIPIPKDEPPGLYWYHPHIHGFTEFQVNGGAAGALVVEGMEKIHPEVAGLTERVFTIRQQYLVPWIPGPYQLTINFQVAAFPHPNPIIQMAPGEKQFWRVANATIQDFLPLQFQISGKAQPMEVIALDGYPLAQTRMQDTILVPPAGRAEFIVQAPPAGGVATFNTLNYGTGPTGNPDFPQILAQVQLTNSPARVHETKSNGAALHLQDLKFADLDKQNPTTQRKLYFSEEFGGTNGPIQFYITVDGQKQKVFEADEKPVITTKVGAVEDWTIENRALETHAFHMHQIHFLVLEVDGKPVPAQEYRDTVEVPYWQGPGTPYHSVKVRMDFRDPTIAGTFVFHCHILLHEDLGMMHKILVEP